jgi:hypothetical protein
VFVYVLLSFGVIVSNHSAIVTTFCCNVNQIVVTSRVVGIEPKTHGEIF